MTVSELYAALEVNEDAAEPRFAGVDPFAARTALAMLTPKGISDLLTSQGPQRLWLKTCAFREAQTEYGQLTIARFGRKNFLRKSSDQPIYLLEKKSSLALKTYFFAN